VVRRKRPESLVSGAKGGVAGFLIRRDARLGARRAACRREALGGGTKGCRRCLQRRHRANKQRVFLFSAMADREKTGDNVEWSGDSVLSQGYNRSGLDSMM
jgi:hypothetical protein